MNGNTEVEDTAWTLLSYLLSEQDILFLWENMTLPATMGIVPSEMKASIQMETEFPREKFL